MAALDIDAANLIENIEPTAVDINIVSPTDYTKPKDQVRNLFKRELKFTKTPSEEGGISNRISITGADAKTNDADEDVVADHLLAIFVVSFDTKEGNVIEWCIPEDADLEGVEFKAMASGGHRIIQDFIYFKKDMLYGLACFENMPVDSEKERGARMKSVGILSTSYTLLYRHMQFLEKQVRHQLQTPGRYSNLRAFYRDKRAILPSSASSLSMSISMSASISSNIYGQDDMPIATPMSEVSSTAPFTSSLTTPLKEELPEMKITHPAGSFAHFIKFFGEKIFTLWKYMLLQKRVIFCSPPPIGMVCYRVYCCCCLANHKITALTDWQPNPLFYINVADIDTLETEFSYVACTTEKIFETKPELYDVYVDNQNIVTTHPALQELQLVSNADRDKFLKLNTQRSQQEYERDQLGVVADSKVDNEEEIFTNFFTELNNTLFQTLLDVAQSQDRVLTFEHMRTMGLDPIGDRQFLMELVEVYGIDVMLMVDNPCCPY